MPNVERLSITLPAEMAIFIRAKVAEGRYASNSEVIREAMQAWRDQERIDEKHLTAVRAKIAEADTDPRPSVTEADVDRHFEERLRRSLA